MLEHFSKKKIGFYDSNRTQFNEPNLCKGNRSLILIIEVLTIIKLTSPMDIPTIDNLNENG